MPSILICFIKREFLQKRNAWMWVYGVIAGLGACALLPSAVGLVLLWVAVGAWLFCWGRLKSPVSAAVSAACWAVGYYGTLLAWMLAIHPLAWMGFSAPVSMLIALCGWLLAVGCQSVIASVIFGLTTWGAVWLETRYLSQRPGLMWLSRSLMLTGAWTAGVWWLNEQPLRMPWGFFAYAHADVLMLRLASSTLTFWGVEALILLTMLTVSELAASLIMNKRMSRLALCVFIGVLMVLTSVTRMHPSLTLPEPYEEKLTPILVQGNVTIEAEHQPRFNVKTTYQPMLAEAAKHMSLKPHTHALAVFPEGIEVYSPQGSTTLCGKAPCPMPLVAGGVVWRPDPVSGQLAVYNAVLAYAQGHAKAAGAIDKRPLVAFGEKIPFVRRGWLSSLMKHWGIEYGESFSEGSSGQAPITIVLDKHHTLRVGGLICFEALYPTIVRQYQHHGANILVTVGNLGWFHHHPMIEPQFIRFNQWRAAESATPLVLVTNTGTSAVIDNQGTIRFRLPSGQRRIERGPTLMIRD